MTVAPSPPPRCLYAALFSTTLFAGVLAWLITHRTALTMDELHTLLLGRLVAQGEALPFYEGSVTRYEGGSWLIAYPVGLLIRLGVGSIAATSWTAGGIACLTVFLSSWWLARHAGAGRAWCLGPVVALASPELMHYSYRAWGSLCEALVALPVLALLRDRWVASGRRLRTTPWLGLALSGAIVLSYFHFLTAGLFALWELLDPVDSRTQGGRLHRMVGVVLVALVAFGGLAGWAWTSGPNPEELLTIRDGLPLVSTLPTLLLPDLVTVLRWLPGAWVGEQLAPTTGRLVAGTLLTTLSAWGFVHAWRAGGPLRGVALFGVVFLPALGLGHRLLPPPDVFRYHLPWLAAASLAIVASGRIPAVLALLLGASLWWPVGLPSPYQNPAYTYLELGGNALHRSTRAPHAKFLAFRSVAEPWGRDWLSFGYGVDSGRRFSPTVSGMRQTLASVTTPAETLRDDPQFHLARPNRWLDWCVGVAEAPDVALFHFGVGHGIAADGRLDGAEVELLDSAGPLRRLEILEGVGANLTRALERPGFQLDEGWDAALRTSASAGDYAAIGRGMAAVSSGQLPKGADLRLPIGAPRTELEEGQQAPIDRARRAMSRVPTVPTPSQSRPEPSDPG